MKQLSKQESYDITWKKFQAGGNSHVGKKSEWGIILQSTHGTQKFFRIHCWK